MAFRVLLLALLLPVSVAAAEIAGVKIDDKTRVADSDLTLNGAGMRTRLFFRVYAIGLYLPQKGSTAAAVLAQPGPKRVAIHMLRDVGADAFTQALTEGIRENHSEAEAKALEPRIKELAAIMAEIKEARKGMTIALDWTGAGTQLVVQGKAAGKPIAGEDFYRALLRIWLGDKPVQDDLKKALLGG
jgi:Chalcone isomerase-like